MKENQPTFLGITFKTIIVHTVSYFVMGILAFTILDYTSLFSDPNFKNFMRQVNDPLVAAGPLFQPIRGILFAVVFYLFRETFFGKKNGWQSMWLALIIIGVFSTFGPAPGSIEGLIFTTIPLKFQLIGLPEVILQALLLSFVLYYWVNHPEKKWLPWTLTPLFILVIIFSVLGILMR